MLGIRLTQFQLCTNNEYITTSYTLKQVRRREHLFYRTFRGMVRNFQNSNNVSNFGNVFF